MKSINDIKMTFSLSMCYLFVVLFFCLLFCFDIMNPFTQLMTVLSAIASASTINTSRTNNFIFQLKLIYLVLNTILTSAPHNEKVLEALKAFPFYELLNLIKRMRVAHQRYGGSLSSFSNSILSFAQ